MPRRTAKLAALVSVCALMVAACGQKEGVHTSVAAGAGSVSSSDLSTDTGFTTGGGAGTSGGAVSGPAAGAPGAATGSAGGSTASGPRAAVPAGGGAAAPVTTAAPTAAGDTTGVSDTEIRIGIHAPVSGAAPFPATSFSNGKQVYTEFLNRTKGGVLGRKVKVYFEDDGYNPSQAVSVCKKLVQQDRVFLLIGGGGADQIVACAQYAASVGVPYVSEGTNEAALGKLASAFAESETYKQQSLLLTQYIRNVIGRRTVSMVRADTANFEDAHSAFISGASQQGLTVVKDLKIPKDASPTDAQTAAGQLCTHVGDADVVYPIMSPSIWINLAAAVKSQGCSVRWAGVGITMGLNIVAQAVCGSQSIPGGASFFSPFPGIDQMDAIDADYSREYKAQNGAGALPDDIGFALWGAEKLLAQQLAAPGKALTRQSFVAALAGKRFSTGVYPDVYYANNHFGGTGVHVLKADCNKAQYVTESTFKSSF